MKSKIIFRVFIVLNLFCLPFSTFAWHSNGHSTAGAVAYYYLLKNNPVVLAKVLATLKQHYWFNTPHWQTRLSHLPAGQQDVGLFMLASTYPDEAKMDPGNMDGNPTHKLWHYVDIPFVVPGSGATGAPPRNPDAELEIAALLSGIPGEQDSPQKAKDLAWLFHLIEDIHQPLHCASMYNRTFPNGDAGGNDVEITAKVDTNLHWYWDELVGGKGFPHWASFGNQLLTKYPENQLAELTTNTTPKSWMYQESFPDAVKYAYVNGTISGTAVNRSVLSASYQSTAAALAERRVVLAGIRLAKLLEQLYRS